MTHKLVPGAKMLAFTVLCLQLSTLAIARHATIRTIAEHEITGYTAIAPEMLDDKKFATLTIRHSIFQESLEMSIKVVGPNYNGRECDLPRSVMIVMSPIALNRVSRKTVVLAIFAVNENVRSKPLRLLLVNTDDCTIRYAYDGVLPWWRSYVFTSTNSSDERFAMIVYGERYCGESEWCRLHFDPIYRRREALDFDFLPEEVDSIEPATESFDADLFVVRVDDSQTNSIRIRLYDLSSNRTGLPYIELLNLPRQKLGVHSRAFWSGLSYCLHVGKSIQEIQCVRFRENGTVMFNETIQSPGLELRAQTVPNGFVLFRTKSICFLKSWCKIVQVAVVTQKLDSGKAVVEMSQREYNLKCHFESSSLRIQLYETTNKIKYLEYLCKDDLHVSSRIIYEH